MTRKLMDDDGENRAVRSFLLGLEANANTVGKMKTHMQMCGHPYWPDWVETTWPVTHLTKAGQQLWLRHLFALEATMITAKANPKGGGK